MMSKFKDLFKNIFKRKSKNDLDEIFYEDEEDFYEDVDDSIESTEDSELEHQLEDDSDLSEMPPVPKDVEPELEEIPELPITAKAESQDKTPQFDEITDEIEAKELNEISQENEEFEDIEDQHDELAEFDEDESDEMEGTKEYDLQEMTSTTEIDLENTNIEVKDKLFNLKTKVSDKFRSMRVKEISHDTTNKKSFKETFKANKAHQISSIDFSKLSSEIFKTSKQDVFHKGYIATLSISSVAATGMIIGTIINSNSNYKLSQYNQAKKIDFSKEFNQKDLNDLQGANLFRTTQVKKEDIPTEPKKDVICKVANKKYSGSDIKLINTIVLQDSVKSVASVQVRSSKELQKLREGDKVSNKLRIDSIESLRLVVNNLNTNECEFIESSDKNKRRSRRSPVTVLSPKKSLAYKKSLPKIKGIENDGNNFKIEKSFLKSKMSNIGDLLTQARGIPMRNPDGTMAFKIVDIEPSGVFAYLGVQDGDVITQINGEPIQNLNQVMTIFGKVTNLSNLQLTVKRGGEEKVQNYSIK